MTEEKLAELFPPEKSRSFFEAFYGDAEDSHFDLRLSFERADDNALYFRFQLIERPGKCLACNLTYGLPHVLERHPVVNLPGLVQNILQAAEIRHPDPVWRLGQTIQTAASLHEIPLIIELGSHE
ncbi:MAG: pancreas/duodenum homeobox protein 1 [Desulfonatronovibrionaceae bacterium]